jgi:drug/metabolite transporter (DMT)-like permease
VRDFLITLASPMVWALFFGTTVYGHVALKVAVDRGGQEGRGVLSVFTNPWGWSACLAWGGSCVLWALTLERTALLQVNAISSLRYVLICLATWWMLGERMTRSQVAGTALILAGILLVKR